MEKVMVGIIGAGYIGREHARCLRLMKPFFGDRLRLVGIADMRKDAAEEAARDFEIGYATDDIDRIFKDDSINTVFSCVPTKFHPDVFRRAVTLGKALFLEKPFAQSLAEVRGMTEFLVAHPAPCQVGFVLRFTPVYHVLKDLIAKRRAGSELMTVILRDDQAFPIRGRMHFSRWRSDINVTGGGVLLEHGIHDIDILEWFFGNIERVRARSKNFAGFKGIEDYISVGLTFAGGFSGDMIHLWHDIEPHQSIRHFEIFFRNSFITLNSYGMEGFTVRDNEADHVFTKDDLIREVKQLHFYPEFDGREDIIAAGDYYAIQDYTFVRNLLEDAPLAPTLEDGARAYAIVQACYASAARNGEEIEIESFLKNTFGY